MIYKFEIEDKRDAIKYSDLIELETKILGGIRKEIDDYKSYVETVRCAIQGNFGNMLESDIREELESIMNCEERICALQQAHIVVQDAFSDFIISR